jgi:hypothetical protein
MYCGKDNIIEELILFKNGSDDDFENPKYYHEKCLRKMFLEKMYGKYEKKVNKK